MKQLITLYFLLLMTPFCFSQNDFTEGYKFSFRENIPQRANGLNFKFKNFIWNSKSNHPFDEKQSGSAISENSGESEVIFKLKDIGRLVFTSKVEINSSDTSDNFFGNIVINFKRRGNIILREERDLQNSWTQSYFTIVKYNIDEINIIFKPSKPEYRVLIDKIRLRSYTKDFIKKLKIKYEQINLIKHEDTNLSSKEEAIRKSYESQIEKLMYLSNKIDKVSTFIEGEALGEMRQRSFNPFNYDKFDSTYKDIIKNASFTEKTNLKEIKKNINKNNWFQVVGNIADVFTGGIFNSLINSLKNIINRGSKVYNQEVTVINGTLYKLNRGKLEKINENDPLFKGYTDIYQKYSDYISFVELLRNKQLIEIKQQKSFDIKKKEISSLKSDIDFLIKEILSSANMKKEDGIDSSLGGEITPKKLIDVFKTRLKLNSENILQNKIKSEVSVSKTQKISSSFYKLISQFRTYYDYKYSEENLNLNLFDNLKNIDPEIKEQWKSNVHKITEQYKNSDQLQNLKNLSR